MGFRVSKQIWGIICSLCLILWPNPSNVMDPRSLFLHSAAVWCSDVFLGVGLASGAVSSANFWPGFLTWIWSTLTMYRAALHYVRCLRCGSLWTIFLYVRVFDSSFNKPISQCVQGMHPLFIGILQGKLSLRSCKWCYRTKKRGLESGGWVQFVWNFVVHVAESISPLYSKLPNQSVQDLFPETPHI